MFKLRRREELAGTQRGPVFEVEGTAGMKAQSHQEGEEEQGS